MHYSQSIVQEVYDIVAYDSSKVEVALGVGRIMQCDSCESKYSVKAEGGK